MRLVTINIHVYNIDKENQAFPSENLSVIKNQIVCANSSPIKNQSDVIQQWDLSCHCHSTITAIKKSDRVRQMIFP